MDHKKKSEHHQKITAYSIASFQLLEPHTNHHLHLYSLQILYYNVNFCQTVYYAEQ